MTKEEKQRLFDANFDIEAFKKVRDEISAISALNCNELYKKLDGYDLNPHDPECDDDRLSYFSCARELDRSHMETNADFVEVEFKIAWEHDSKCARIDGARLYVAYPEPQEIDGMICSFDPYTYEIKEWFID